MTACSGTVVLLCTLDKLAKMALMQAGTRAPNWVLPGQQAGNEPFSTSGNQESSVPCNVGRYLPGIRHIGRKQAATTGTADRTDPVLLALSQMLM